MLYRVLCALFTEHWEIYDIICTVYNAYYLAYCFEYKMQSVQCTVYIVQCTVYSVQCTVYSVQCTMYSVQCTVHYEVEMGQVAQVFFCDWNRYNTTR